MRPAYRVFDRSPAFDPAAAAAPRIADLAAARTLFASLAAERHETVGFAFLGPEWQLLSLRCWRSPTQYAIDLAPREVLAWGLGVGATGAVMAHNHPGGDVRPSRDDIAVTRRLATTMAAVGIDLYDHLIVTANDCASFRLMGLL